MIEKIINGIKYRLNEETQTAEVIKKSEGYEGDIIIPETVVFNDVTYRVTSIGRGAFSFCQSLTNITIPDSINSIEDRAFDCCKSLTSITIPDCVTSIGEAAFWGCESLTSINIPDSVKDIGDCAFFACSSLPAITIPDSVNIMGESAFENCFSLKTITYIGTAAQWNSWQRGSHWNYNTPSEIVVEPMATLINGIYYRLNKGKLTAKVIQRGSSERNIAIPKIIEFNGVSYLVTSIGEYAFSGCESLNSINIPDSVTSIEDYAFGDCSYLTSVTIPTSVTSIGRKAFACCFKLPAIIIPNSVTSIGSWAFAGCYNLTNITIPASVKSIGGMVLLGCNLITSIIFQGTVAQWNEIELSNGWNHEVPVTIIHCTDGDVEM